ncbi:hypothetical protein ACLBX9_16660 [Methylobacterium sp. A49B]
MATKTIVANVTLHLPGKGHEPFKIDANGAVAGGKYVVKAVPPGTPAELDADEADALIAAKMAEEYKPAETEKAAAPAKGAASQSA